MVILNIPEEDRLPNLSVWVNRFEIRSNSSTRLYVVAQHRMQRFWGCSCPGWKSQRKCKHLAALGLPAHQEPFEVRVRGMSENRFLSGYRSYDASQGFGSTEELKNYRQALSPEPRSVHPAISELNESILLTRGRKFRLDDQEG